MEKRIEEIYGKNKVLFRNVEWAVHFFHIQNQDAALRASASILEQLMGLIPLYVQQIAYFNEDKVRYGAESLTDICRLLLEAQEQKDYVLLADYYELYLLPLLRELQEKIAMDEGGYPADFQAEKYSGYQVEYTSTGAVTLCVQTQGVSKYFHSNKSPYHEAMELAESWYQEDKYQYIIYGLGLGYHVQALGLLDANISIRVYESDKKVFELYEQYGVKAELSGNSNIEVCYDPELKKMFAEIGKIDEDGVFVIHEPSLSSMNPSVIKEKLENYFINYSSIKNQRKLLNGNFRVNIKRNTECVDSLKADFKGKTLYLVGAGPSLDKNFAQLKEVSREKSVIVSSGTAFHKLIKAGIRPDFVIETDANTRISWHFREVGQEQIPMLLLSTATHVLNDAYAGKKFLIFQEGVGKAEAYAKEHGYTLYETGGSVMTTALDVGIRMQCKKIVFLGMDLAYTDDYAHAQGTSRRAVVKEAAELREVKDIAGQTIYTNRSLDMYRQWMEERIAREDKSGIAFIDATEGGARIKGTRVKTLAEVLNNEC